MCFFIYGHSVRTFWFRSGYEGRLFRLSPFGSGPAMKAGCSGSRFLVRVRPNRLSLFFALWFGSGYEGRFLGRWLFRFLVRVRLRGPVR